MHFWVGSNIKLPLRQLTQGDLSQFDLNEEGGVAMTTLEADARQKAGRAGFIYQCDVRPASILKRNHRDMTVVNFIVPLEQLVARSPDYHEVLAQRYGAENSNASLAKAHKRLMKDLLDRGMLGAALDFVFVHFYKTKRWQFSTDVVRYLGFDGRFYRVKKTNLDRLSPDHPEHVEQLPRLEKQFVKTFATIWNLGCVKILNETPLKS